MTTGLADDLLLLSSLLRQGMPAERAAAKLGEGWIVDVELERVLSGRLPGGYAAALAQSRDVPQALERAAAVADGRDRLAARLRTATFYPVALVLFFVVAGAVVMSFSSAAASFYGDMVYLPRLTRLMLFLMRNVPVLIVLAVLALPLLRKEAFLVRLPGFGAAMRDSDGELFFAAFSQLAGTVPLPEALRLAGQSCVLSRIRQEFAAAADALERGDSLRAALRRARWIPPLVCILLSLAEERQFRPEVLEDAARMLARESELRALTQLYFLTPLVTLLVAGGLLLFAIAFLMPVYQLTGSI